jgi:ABC-type branched-subunit amino acid transport system substrate-binding protein
MNLKYAPYQAEKSGVFQIHHTATIGTFDMADHQAPEQGVLQTPRQQGIWAALKSAGTAVAMAGAILLAGCQTMVPRTAPPVEPVRPVTPPPPQSDALPTDTERNRVALIVPISGPNAGVGQSIANATTLALLETRNDKVRITTYDAFPNATAAAQRAVAEGNRLILGPLLAEDVKRIAPVARRAGVPVISYSNDASVAGDGIFLMGFNPVQSIERVVGYAHAKGVKRFAALVPRGTYGERAGTAFLRAVEQAGGTVTAMETFDRSAASTAAAAVKKLQAASPYEAILIADSGRVAIQVAPLVRKAGGAKARILGTELWNTEGAVAGDVDLRGAWFASVSDGLYGQLATRYRQRYGVAPYRLSSLGYDSVLLTVRIAQNWRPGTPFPVARLTDPDGFAGVDGAFRFGRSGIAERMLEISQVNAGSFSTVDPAAKSFAP